MLTSNPTPAKTNLEIYNELAQQIESDYPEITDKLALQVLTLEAFYLRDGALWHESQSWHYACTKRQGTIDDYLSADNVVLDRKRLKHILKYVARYVGIKLAR